MFERKESVVVLFTLIVSYSFYFTLAFVHDVTKNHKVQCCMNTCRTIDTNSHHVASRRRNTCNYHNRRTSGTNSKLVGCHYNSQQLRSSFFINGDNNNNNIVLYSTASQSTADTTTTNNSVENDDNDGPVVGDTRGASLLLENVSISRGSNQLLSDIDLRVEPGQRWAIVGPNGAGKSTLLGAITGTVRMDQGSTALIGPKIRVGYLKQTAVAGSVKTVAEEAASEMYDINNARSKMNQYEEMITNGDTSTETLNKLEKATTEFTNVGGWSQEQEVDTVLRGLGFLPEDSSRLCSDFSGGWQMRIALARLLLSRPTLLLLDEPSNHLDSTARDWLATYLAKYNDGSIVLVSHDVQLLEKSANNIAEVSGGTLLKYVSCTYSKYLEEKEFRAKTAQTEYERNMAEAARLQAFVDKWGASATKASAAQSRVKMIEKMKKEGKLTPPPQSVVQTSFKPELVLPDPPKAIGEELISIENADIGYDDDSPPLLTGVSLILKRGMKLILRGPNGSGKSTLMNVLRGKLTPINGNDCVINNEQLRLGVFTQDLAQELDSSRRAVDIVTAHAREGEFGDITISDQQARGVMGRLGLGGDKPLRLVGSLSGGEKARVALSMFAIKASNTLILDEPSNHLDVECIDALSHALSNWGGDDGAIVVVSHDRAFCEEVGFTHVGTVKDGKFVLEERNLNDSDWDQYDINGAAKTIADKEISASATKEVELTPEEKEEMKRKRKLAYNAPKRISKLEDMIDKCEQRIADIDDEMMQVGNNMDKLTDLQKLKEEEETKVMNLTEEWEELEELLIEMS